MIKYITVFIVFLIISFPLFSQEKISIHQQQAEYFKNNPHAADQINAITRLPRTDLQQAKGLSKIVYGFHPYWITDATASSYYYNLLTHIAYFSADVDTGASTTGGFLSTHNWSTTQVVTYCKNNNVKIHLTIVMFANHDRVLNSATNRANLVNNILTQIRNRNADGAAVDFESMSSSVAGNFSVFIKLLGDSLKANNKELVIAVPAVDWSGIFSSSFFTTNNPVVTYYFIMAYDYYWKGSSTAGPIAPLTTGTSTYHVTRSINTYKTAGAPAAKLITGFPYYGYDWPVVSSSRMAATSANGTSVLFYNAEYKYDTSSASNKFFDPTYNEPWYRYLSGTQWHQAWFEDSVSLYKKYDTVKAYGIAGSGMWALGYDNGYSDLWGALKAAYAPTVFYNVASSDVANLNNWGTNADGTGTHPSNFTNDGQTFNLFNTGATCSSNWTVSGTSTQVNVGNGSAAATLTIPSGITLTLGTDAIFTISSLSTLTINGTLDNASLGAFTISGTMTVNNSGNYKVDVYNGIIPQTGLFQAGSNLQILAAPNTGSTLRLPTTFGGNVIWNVPDSTRALINATTLASTVEGSFTLVNGIVYLGNGNSTVTMTIKGNLNIQGGEFQIIGGGSNGLGNKTDTVYGNINVSGGYLNFNNHTPSAAGIGAIVLKGNFNHTAGTVGITSGAQAGLLQLTGTTQQQLSTTGITNAVSVTLNNAAGLALASNANINGTLTLTNGVVSLGNYNLTLGISSTISGTPSSTRMISSTGTGELRKVFTGNTSFTFPIGDLLGTAEYSPVTVTLNSNSGLSSAYIGARVKNTKHPNNTSTDSLKRYWSLSSSGITSPNYTAVFTYLPADVAGNEGNMYGGKWDGASWTFLGAVNTTSHTITAGSLSSFSDFTAGESDHMGAATGYVTVKVIPQGLYRPSNDRLIIKDTVTVFLANSASPYAFIDTSKIVIDSLSFTGQAAFSRAANGQYYVVVRHRNSIALWNKTGGMAFHKGITQSWDFTADSSQTFGTNVVKLGSRWCMYSGDCNQDGTVDISDMAMIDNDSFTFRTGYVTTDLNGDRIVDISDMVFADNNSFIFASVKKPTAK